MRTILLAILLIALPNLLFAKAAYWPKHEMIKRAEIIAIVDISSVEPAKVKGKHWTYGEVANAKVERVLKGDLPKEVKLHGKENFICARVSYKPGKALVFLRQDEGLLVGVNWHLGVREIVDGKIDWFAGDKGINTTPQDFETVLREIETMLKKSD